MQDVPSRKPIAIVGIGCRFPGGVSSPAQFWNLLCDGLDAITEVPPDRFDLDQFFDPDPAVPGKTYSRWGGFVDRIDAFDADFFGIAPREACRIDPQQRLLLEVVWEALEDNGQPTDRLAGVNAGVFIGIASHDYTDMQILPWNRERIDAHTNAGGAMCIAANRISYLLDLRGPSLAVDTACSSSLTAVHLACRSIAAGECELAIAGGVNVLLAPEPTIGFCKTAMLSPDGRCHAFDARANGYVRGEGAGAVILKPLERALEDGDSIYAVIRGSAINQDGRTPGLSVPSAAQQKEMLRQALREANVSACAIQYVEAHGTGTAVGDPIEADAIGTVFSNGRAPGEYCLIGSVKTNFGHLEAGAGIAGLIKAALALKYRKIPPSLHFSEPNAAIPFEQLRLRVPTTLEPWPETRGPAMAGVNSFGFGGANAHVLLEEPPAPGPIGHEPAPVAAYVLTCSARHPDALRELAGHHARQLAASGSVALHDYCYTAAVCRTHYEHRLGAIAGSHEELIGSLEAFSSGQETGGVFAGRSIKKREPKLAFVFTGMGPQWWNMGEQLMREQEVFRTTVAEVDVLLRPMTGWSLLEELAADEAASHVNDAYVAHVANFAIQLGLAALWRSWGIVPDAVVGHSSGEMAAACVSGALAVADAVRLACHRGRLQQRTTGSGRMLAAGIPADEARRFLTGVEDRVSIAAFNAPESVTLSGEATALEHIASMLTHEQRYCRFLPVEVPYHGPQMETIREDLLSALGDLRPRATEIPLFSGVTGERVAGPELDRTYWWRNVREPVRFATAIDGLAEEGCELFVEVGPHPVLAASITECFAQRGRVAMVLPSLRRGQDEWRTMLCSLAALYVHGRRVQWSKVYPSGARVPLPMYPWRRERHWFEPELPSDAAFPYPVGTASGHPLLGRRLRSPYPIWETELRHERVSFLDEHVMQESAVFPAAGYVEMVLAAAQQFEHHTVAVERFAFHRLLFLDRSTSILQLLYRQEQSTVEIYAGTRQDDPSWTLHATAMLQSSPGAADEASDLSAIRERCVSRVGATELYTSLERRGLRYGPAFKGVRELWLRDNEALARIALDRRLQDAANTYCVHPALLDAAFQVLLAAGDAGPVPVPDGLLNLPTAITRMECFSRLGAACWSHAVVTRRHPDGFEGDVSLFDDTGRVLLRCRGLRLRALAGSSQHSDVEKWLYEECWEEMPLQPSMAFPRLPSPSATAAAVAKAVQSPGLATALPDHYEAAGPALHRIAVHHISTALRKLGWTGNPEDCSPDALADALGVVSQHRQLFARLLAIVQTDASVQADHPLGGCGAAPDVAEVRAAYPEHDMEFELVERCGSRLAEILRGETDPRQLLFGDSLDALTWFYRTSPTASHCNELAAIAVAVAGQGHRATATPLRILEIGAGTGGLTSAVLSGLVGAPVDYFFTDISPYFLRRAREEFKNRSDVRFGVLDVEAEPLAQGLAPGSFDIILGANVLHTTADLRQVLGYLRSVLAPGGLLVLLELTRKLAWMDIIFGLLEGWWRFTDRDLRSTHPLLGQDQWQRLLSEAGFEDTTVVADPVREECALQSVFLAGAPSSAVIDGPRRRWLLLADRRGAGAQVAAGIREHGDSCICVYPGHGFVRHAQDNYEIAPTRDDARRLLTVLEAEGPLHGVVHLWSLDAPLAEMATAGEIIEAQRLGCGSALYLIQAIEAASPPPAGVWLATSGSQAVGGEPEAIAGLSQAPLWGFGRVLANERPELHPRLVDLGPGPTPEEIEAFVAELFAGAPGGEIALRGRQRWVRRLRHAALSGAHREDGIVRVSPDTSAFYLEIKTPGTLDTLRLRESPSLPTPPGHVSIRVRAAGLNFRDVMLALGLLPSESSGTELQAGIECAGVVLDCGEGVETLRPGDEVIALAIGALGSRATAREELVVPKPPNLSFEEAASIASAYLTAHYGLIDLARMKAGDRVLIHSASGGIGHAALGLCQRAGVEIFATAGTPEKRAYLRSLGIQHVMDSRSLAWATEVLEGTGGEGVDIVLNSLAGAAIPKGLEILRPFGRFVEIGKRDIYANTEMGLLPFQKNLAFFSVDLLRLCAERPAETGATLRHLVTQIAGGALPLPPRTHFDVAQAEQAFRLMAQARHIGKVMLTLGQPEYEVRPQEEQPLFRPDATYLITGGLGGFGLAVATWMANQGARHLVLMSRSRVRKEDEEKLRRLEASAATVRLVEGDVSAEQDIARTLATIQAEMPPLRGVMHLAMVLDDAMLGQLDEARFRTVMEPKIAGAWNLHCLTAELGLDHFVLFSSLSAVVGNPGQGNYAAANSFLDALATFRCARGLPAVAIAWGPVAEVGYLARHEEIQQVLSHLGISSLTPAEATSILGQILRHAPPYLVAARIERGLLQKMNRSAVISAENARTGDVENAQADALPEGAGMLAELHDCAPAERARVLEMHLLQRLSKVLAAAPGKTDPERPLIELGLDSLLAVELLTAIKLDVGVQVPVVKLLQGISTRDLVALILQELGFNTPAGASCAAPADTGTGDAAADAGAASSTLPLAFEQRRFWFLEQVSPGNPAQHAFIGARLLGRLDPAALRRSIQHVVHRHEAMRAGFRQDDGEILQTLAVPAPVPFPVQDLRHVPADEREAELQRLATAEIRKPFDLSQPPLLRALLVQLDDNEHAVILVVHHICVDTWTITVIVREVMALYDAFVRGLPSSLPLPSVRYADYVRQQQEALPEHAAADQLEYWKRQLEGASVLRLPTDRPPQPAETFRGGHLRFELSPHVSDALMELSRRQGVTLFMTLVAAFQTLLCRYSGETDICIGTAVSTRNSAGMEELVGCCMNTVVLRTDLSGDPTFRELLERVRDTTLGAFSHQDLPFDRVVEALRPEREPHRSPLFQAMMVLHNLRRLELRMEGLVVEPLDLETGATPCDLTLLVDTGLVDAGERVRGSLEYDADLFDAATMARMFDHFQTLLESVVVSPDQRLSMLPLLSEAERRRILVEWNHTEVTFDQERCLHELFERQVESLPDAVAVEFGTQRLTYRELDARANRMAARLVELGVGPDVVVGLGVGPSPEMLVGLLGTLKAGGAYLPLDPAYPRERWKFMLRDAHASVLLTLRRLLSTLPDHEARVVLLDEDPHDTALEDLQKRPDAGVTADDLAYIIYTSGSTGDPKGVMVSHRAISNQVHARQLAFPLTPADVVLQRTPLGFDPSVWELLGPLCAGARLVVPASDAECDSAGLIRLIRRHRVTVLQIVPSVLGALLEEPDVELCGCLRHVLCGGEPMTSRLRDRFFDRLPGVELHNLYGPAEATIDTTSWTCQKGRQSPVIPIGWPLANMQVYILDGRQQPVPIGVAGELYIGGAGLARGYLNRPTLTAEKFIPHPFSDTTGARLYRTGDLAQWLPDGTITWLGRIDEQVKIRGCRVEPGEVAAVLMRHPGVREAIVMDREDVRSGRRLIAYVATGEQDLSAESLQGYLAGCLPKYMMPSGFVIKRALPRSPNGKVDRQALAALDQSFLEFRRTYVAPRDVVELQLVQLWEEYLETRPISITDNFFDLGGHSLLVMRLISRIRKTFGHELPVSSLVRTGTVEDLACLLRQNADPGPRSPIVALHPYGSERPFFCVHPASGSVLCYMTLAHSIGSDRPFYGLQSPALDGNEDSPARIEEMAAEYLKAVETIQDEGPYFLGGWSMGSSVAYEMACQLQEQGRHVALLALFDPPPVVMDWNAAETSAARLSQFAESIGIGPGQLATAVRGFAQLGPDEQLACILDQARRACLIPADLDLSQLRRRLHVHTANLEALKRYRPRPFGGRITLFEATEGAMATDHDWETLAAGGVAHYTMPGDHYSMLQQPGVDILGRRLKSLLQTASHAAATQPEYTADL
jgi:amino acid adenylation domain-containing protein